MKKILDPIAFYNDKKFLIFNLIFFGVGTLVSIFMRAWFDNTFHLSFRTEINALNTFIENTFSVLLIMLAIFLCGKIINGKVRLIDCLNLSFYIRIPFYLLTLSNINGTFSGMLPTDVSSNVVNINLPTDSLDYTLLIVSSILGLIIIVFQLIAIYKGFKTLSNAKKVGHYLLLVSFIIVTIILSTYLFKKI